MPLIWLPFMVWVFVDPLWTHYGPLGWVANTFGGIVFILLYLQAFSRPEPYKLLSILAMTAMAPVFIHVNEGNVALLIYAAAAGGFHPSLRRVSLLVGLDVAILGFYAYRLANTRNLLGLDPVAGHTRGIRQSLLGTQTL